MASKATKWWHRPLLINKKWRVGMMPCDTEKNSTPCVTKSWAVGGEEHASVHD